METEMEPSMQTLQKFAITAVFSLTCFTVPVMSVAAADAIPKLGSGSGLGTGTGNGTGPGQVVPPVEQTPVDVGNGLGAGGTGGSASDEAQVPGGPSGANLGGGTQVDEGPKAEAKALKEALEAAFKAKNREASLLLKEKSGTKVSTRIRQERLKLRAEKPVEVVAEQGTMARKALLDVNYEDLRKKPTDYSELRELGKERMEKGKEGRERRDVGGP